MSRETKNIEDYLPNAFGPEDLNNKFALFSKPVIDANTLNVCLNASYAPYSDNKAACQILDDEGNQYFGLYIENAAYSPSLSPLQAALNQMQLHKRSLQIDTIFDNIKQIRVLETAGKANQAGVTDAVAACLPEHITVEYEQA